jgi:hypothetical protein
MKPLCRWLALAAVALSLVCLTSHRHVRAAQPNPQYITLSLSGSTCEQDGGTGPVDVYEGTQVIFTGSGLSEFQVQFSSCPFNSCPVNSSDGSAVDVGVPTGAVGTYSYSSMTINNQACSVGSMGIGLKNHP